MLAFTAAATMSVASCALTQENVIAVRGEQIELAEILAPDCPLRAEQREMVVAALPPGMQSVRLTRAALASLARRRVPALEIVEGGQSNDLIEVNGTALASPTPRQPCFEAASPVPQGAPLTRANVNETECSQSRPRMALIYDRGNAVVRASEPTASGSYIGRLQVDVAEVISVGDPLVLRVSVGPVEISRQVVAAQTAHRGEALFVQDGDGNVFAAPSSDNEGRAQ